MKTKTLNSKHSFSHSSHSLIRSSQRGINDQVIELVVNYGLLIKKQGYNFYLGTKKSFPSSLDHKLKEKASNVLVLVKENTIVTCYKNEKVMKEVKRKSRRNLKKSSAKD
jgi:hypothetical protein